MEQETPLLNPSRSAYTDINSEAYKKESELPRQNQHRWENIKHGVRISALYNILPRYLQPGGREEYSKAKLHPTAYLDAVRGYAAFIVFFYHGWSKTTFWVFQLPFIRTFVLGGPGMVAIFFVISGYVLSYRILRMIRNKESAQLLDALSSSMFRRWLRLYGSTAIATFVAACCVSLGWYLPIKDLAQPTFLGQMWHWFLSTLIFSNPFANVEGWVHDNALYTPYLNQMWTIPVEFRGSIVLFCFCISSAKLSVRSRMIYLWLVILLSYYWRCLYVPEFLYGMFVAEVSFSRHPERLGRPVLPTEENEKPLSKQLKMWRLSRTIASPIGSSIAMIIGIILLGQPDPPGLGELGPFPFQYLVHFIPPWYGEAAYTFWLSIGAFLVVISLDSSPVLQKPFTWSFSRYIGDLSFGIYAMHILWIDSLYKKVLLNWQTLYLGDSYPAYIPGILIVTICMLWSADYFRRADRMVVDAGRWLQKKAFLKWQ
jgi:peptidoglycan/LPS O-acetylase OafA/YrhL